MTEKDYQIQRLQTVIDQNSKDKSNILEQMSIQAKIIKDLEYDKRQLDEMIFQLNSQIKDDRYIRNKLSNQIKELEEKLGFLDMEF